MKIAGNSRIAWLIVCFALLANDAAPTGLAASPKVDRGPNIVFVLGDDHAAHAVSAYASRINATPNIDRLAAEGMRFDNCFVTNSICGPSRAVMLTGKYSHLNGVPTNADAFDGSQPTFPKLLQQAGYQTALVGKWHLKSSPTGFDYSNVLIDLGPYYNPPMIENGENVKYEGYTTEILTDLALDWLNEKRDKSKPFMLMLQHKAPHRPWHPSPKHFSRYEDRDVPEPPTLFDDYAGRGIAATQQKMTVAHDLGREDLKLDPPGNLTPSQLNVWKRTYGPRNEAYERANLSGKELIRWKYQRYIKEYLRCVDSVDDSLGQILAYLDENDLAENTVVVYSSDNGWFLGDHGWYDKRWMYEESLRIPLLVRWPAVVGAGETNAQFVSNVDFAPTFIGIAGSATPEEMQGRSLVPLLKGEAPSDWRKSFYYHYYEFPGSHDVARHEGVRTDRYKLLHFYDLNEWELYDLQADPGELKNLFQEPKYEHVVQELQVELQRLQDELQVPEKAE